jgi:transposase-like protein
VQRFAPLLADAARFARTRRVNSRGDRWFVDETYLKVNGVWRSVYRAVGKLIGRHTSSLPGCPVVTGARG